MEELHLIQDRWGIDEIRFSDDHFCMDAQWLKEFAPLYRKEIGRPFTVNARVDVLDEEKISLLAEAGCRLLCFGIETGRESLRNRVLKKKITDEQIFIAADLLNKYGIKYLSSNIIGLPGEQPEDAWKTIKINQKIGTHLPWYSMMQYYPGTQIHKDAVAADIIPEDFNPDFITNYFKNDYMRSDHIHELQNIHSFSILTSWLPWLTRPAQYLAHNFKSNILFKSIFKATYLLLSVRRANLSLKRIFTGLPRYWKRI